MRIFRGKPVSTKQPLRDADALNEDGRFRLIFETAFQFIGLLDANGRMLEVNRPALAWARSTREAVLGQLVWDTPWWIHAGDAVRERLKAAVMATARGEFVRYDVTLPSIDGPKHTFDFSLTPVADEAGKIDLLIAEGRDITEQKRLEQALREANEQLHSVQEQLRLLAITDDLTGLYNRRGFFFVAERQKALAVRSHFKGLLMFADIDGLKSANDRFGHDAGDELIVGAAKVLTRTVRATDLVARLGGDEFVALASLSSGESTAAIANRLASHLDAFNSDVALRTPLQMSIGTLEFQWTDELALESLVSRADAAMYEQKRSKSR